MNNADHCVHVWISSLEKFLLRFQLSKIKCMTPPIDVSAVCDCVSDSFFFLSENEEKYAQPHLVVVNYSPNSLEGSVLH